MMNIYGRRNRSARQWERSLSTALLVLVLLGIVGRCCNANTALDALSDLIQKEEGQQGDASEIEESAEQGDVGGDEDHASGSSIIIVENAKMYMPLRLSVWNSDDVSSVRISAGVNRAVLQVICTETTEVSVVDEDEPSKDACLLFQEGEPEGFKDTGETTFKIFDLTKNLAIVNETLPPEDGDSMSLLSDQPQVSLEARSMSDVDLSWNVWTITYKVLEIGKFYKEQVDEMETFNSQVERNYAALEAMQFAIQEAIDKSIMDGSFDNALLASARQKVQTSPVGKEESTFTAHASSPPATDDQKFDDELRIAGFVILGFVAACFILLQLASWRKRIQKRSRQKKLPKGREMEFDNNTEAAQAGEQNDVEMALVLLDSLPLKKNQTAHESSESSHTDEDHTGREDSDAGTDNSPSSTDVVFEEEEVKKVKTLTSTDAEQGRDQIELPLAAAEDRNSSDVPKNEDNAPVNPFDGVDNVIENPFDSNKKRVNPFDDIPVSCQDSNRKNPFDENLLEDPKDIPFNPFEEDDDVDKKINSSVAEPLGVSNEAPTSMNGKRKYGESVKSLIKARESNIKETTPDLPQKLQPPVEQKIDQNSMGMKKVSVHAPFSPVDLDDVINSEDDSSEDVDLIVGLVMSDMSALVHRESESEGSGATDSDEEPVSSASSSHYADSIPDSQQPTEIDNYSYGEEDCYSLPDAIEESITSPPSSPHSAGSKGSGESNDADVDTNDVRRKSRCFRVEGEGEISKFDDQSDGPPQSVYLNHDDFKETEQLYATSFEMSDEETNKSQWSMNSTLKSTSSF